MPLVTTGLTEIAKLIVGEAGAELTNGLAKINVGDGTTVFDVAQADLQGVNKVSRGMDVGFPQRSGATITFQATFPTNEANFAWNEWGISSDTTLYSRKVESLGTKTNTQVWEFTVDVELSA